MRTTIKPHAATFVLPSLPEGFRCLLDEQPDHLVPEYQLRHHLREEAEGALLFLNPGISFGSEAGMIWVADPATNLLQPFWVGPELSNWLVRMEMATPVPLSLSHQDRRSLSMAKVLVRQDYVSARRAQWLETVSHCATQFRQCGYASVAGLIHPFHVSALRRHCRGLARTGQLRLGDDQSSRRYVAHNESVACFFHHQLTASVSVLAGYALKPSYVYLACYQDGAVLEKHTDRAQCEVSISFCLDYSPEPGRETPWPIELHPPSGTVTVFQALGDALLYRGPELPHSRERLPAGHSSTSIFFHYVAEDFTGPLD